jgi:hypothetical protein
MDRSAEEREAFTRQDRARDAIRGLLDSGRFKAYVEAKPEGAPMGLTCNTGRCPVALYLRETLPADITEGAAVVVGNGYASLHSPAFSYADHHPQRTQVVVVLHDWFRVFIVDVDTSGGSREVTREEVLAVIAGMAERGWT